MRKSRYNSTFELKKPTLKQHIYFFAKYFFQRLKNKRAVFFHRKKTTNLI